MSTPHLTLRSGLGLVVANMVGAGVFLSTGFMAQKQSPASILLAWAVGGVLALCGAVAYAEAARLVKRGGGEYTFLSAFWHPALGYVAGWGSLIIGFSAPIALDALAAGAFARTLLPWLEPRLVAAALVVALTAVHAVGLRSSTRVQDVLVAIKVALLVGFVVVGVAFGSLAFPTWLPPSPGPSAADDFLGSLFYIAFAYSGWNAAAYAYDDFADAGRDVPLAMLLGCLVVGALYLAVNYLFVANLTPAQGTVVFRYDDFTSLKGQWDEVTLGQAVMGKLLGPGAAQAMSAVMLLLFTSAMSAMTMVGPRVYSAMAQDGVLPRAFLPAPGKPSVWGLLVQAALALAILFTHELRTVLANVGAILTLFAALTCAGLFAVSVRPLPSGTRPGAVALVCAALYVALAGWMLVFRFGSAEGLTLLGWLGGVCLVALVAYAASRRAAG